MDDHDRRRLLDFARVSDRIFHADEDDWKIFLDFNYGPAEISRIVDGPQDLDDPQYRRDIGALLANALHVPGLIQRAEALGFSQAEVSHLLEVLPRSVRSRRRPPPG